MINTRNSKRINLKIKKKGYQNHHMWGRKVRKSRLFFLECVWACMTIRLNKASRHRKGLTHLKNRATTNQTSYSQKCERRGHRRNIKGNHQTKKKKKKGMKEKHRINWKSRSKMAIDKYLSIITWNVNGLNAPVKRQSGRLDKKQEPTYKMLSTGDSP